MQGVLATILDRLASCSVVSPRQSDVMIVAGTLTNNKMAPALRKFAMTKWLSLAGLSQWVLAQMVVAITIILFCCAQL